MQVFLLENIGGHIRWLEPRVSANRSRASPLTSQPTVHFGPKTYRSIAHADDKFRNRSRSKLWTSQLIYGFRIEV